MVHDNLTQPVLAGRSRMVIFLLNAKRVILSVTPPAGPELGADPDRLTGCLFDSMLDQKTRGELADLENRPAGTTLETRNIAFRPEPEAAPLEVTLRAERLSPSLESLTPDDSDVRFVVSLCVCRPDLHTDELCSPAIPLGDLPGREGVLLLESPGESIYVPVYANRAFAELVRRPTRAFKGRPTNLLGGLRPGKKVMRRVRDAMETGHRFEETALLTREDGTRFWADIRFQPLEDQPDGRFLYLTTVMDVTRRKRREAELRQAREESEQARQSQEMFLANMSHEIRTPLSGILGMAELLEMSGLDDSQRDKVTTLLRSARSLVHMMNDIQFYSDLESDRIHLVHRPFDLAGLVERLRDTCREKAEHGSNRFEIELDPELPDRLSGDEQRVEQTLTRILDNAFKFTENGNVELHIRLEDENDREVLVGVEVSDSGVGVPEKLQARLFDRFSKGTEMSARYAGVGLGLAITRKLAGLLDASMDIESSEETGTRIRLTLPFGKADSSAGKGASSVPSAAAVTSGDTLDWLKGKTILAAEDHPVNRKLLQGLLRPTKVRLLLAENGREALERFRTHRETDLVLMDIHMPEMNGLEATREIRQSAPPSKRPIIVALTASVMGRDLERYRQAGIDDLLEKPYTRHSLFELLRRHLGLPQGAAKTETSETPIQRGIIRMETLDELVAGDRSMLIEMLELFLEQTPDLLSELEQAVELQDWNRVGRTAHKLKPTLRYVGLERGFRLAMELETAADDAASGHTEPVIGKTRELAKLVRQGISEVRTLLKSLR